MSKRGKVLVGAGVAYERVAFRPHITLARARQRDDRELGPKVLGGIQSLPRRRRPAGFPVRGLVLFRSQLMKDGPLHTVLSEHAFAVGSRGVRQAD